MRAVMMKVLEGILGSPPWFRLRGSPAALLIVAPAVIVTAFAAVAGCGGTSATESSTTTTAATVEKSDIVLASTTSTQDSGLFDVLVPAFEAAYPQYTVKVVAAGTGEALKLGENKDADVLLVHAPTSEKEFVENGFGTERFEVMYNDFVIVGPADDPAGIGGMADTALALKTISVAEALFVSRGDDSGTHKKELSLWKAAGIEPSGAWYESAGQGMGDVLAISSEKQAYTLSDRASYLNLLEGLDLEVLVEGDKALFNQYGVIPVTDATNAPGAADFAAWIISAEGQAVISDYGVEKFGQPLFVPNAG